MYRRHLAFLIILLPMSMAHAQRPAEAIYTNAQIWTGNPDRPWAEALAVRKDVIVGIGSAEGVQIFQGPNTRVVDVAGGMIVPGFVDNHVHFLSGGFQLASVNLREADSPEAFAERLGAFAASRPQGHWITGGNWDHERWGGELPHRRWIDSRTEGHPVFVSRLDGHMALANTEALALAGITRNTPDPEGGIIVRDPETGEPTGVLKDTAMELVGRVLPAPSEEELDAALERAMDHAVSLGITQVHDVGSFGGWTDLQTFRRVRDDGRFRLRVYSMVPVATWERLDDYVKREGRGDRWIRWGGLKGFVDGSLGSTTAWFYDPYADAPETNGLTITDTSALRHDILEADARGFHLAIHAIGDKANDWLLDTFAEAVALNGARERRFRIEHAQHLSPEAITRFAEQGVIPSMQPYHAIDDGRWAEGRIGPKRLETTYSFRSLLDAGASLTFGSDWTVAPINPLEGIYAAVTRRTLDGLNDAEGWVPEQKITVEEALRAYTQTSAYAGFWDQRLGTLEVGKWADFVVLSENLVEIDPVQIKEVQVLRTVVAGREEYVKE